MINQFSASLTRARLALSSTLFICLSFVLPAFAAPNPIKIDFADSGGILEFSLLGTQGTISRKDLSFALSGTLLKIELANAEIDRKKYWIKSFTESKSDSDIKGIMVRRHPEITETVQIRVRYKKRIPLSEKGQIKLVEIPNGLKVLAPRTYKVDPIKNAPSALNTKSDSPKPSLDPKLSKINTLTSALKDETKNVDNPTRQGQSIYDQGQPTAPLPPTEPLRSTGVLSTTQKNDQMPSSSLQALNTQVYKTANENIKANESPILTAKSLTQESMSSQSVKDLSPRDNQAGTFLPEAKSPYDLDQLSSLMSYVVLFLVLLWSASFFFKRGKSIDNEDLGNAITIRSQKVVGLSPRQRIMVVETMGHTFVVGSCERGGLSHIAHLSTPNGPIGGSTFTQSAHQAFNQDNGSLDALSRFSNQDSYYASHSYPIEDQDYVRHTSPSEANVTFEESTFVGEEDAFTAEVEPVNNPTNLTHSMASSDAYQQGEVNLSMDHLDQYSRQEDPNTSDENIAAGFEVGNDEDVNMKPGDLLQWIQKLNGTKG